MISNKLLRGGEIKMNKELKALFVNYQLLRMELFIEEKKFRDQNNL
jgi:hypothetical protein